MFFEVIDIKYMNRGSIPSKWDDWIITFYVGKENGYGGGGIRTPDSLARIPVFETGALNHYATPPLNLCSR